MNTKKPYGRDRGAGKKQDLQGHVLLLARPRGAYGLGRWYYDFDGSNRRNTRTLLLSPLE